MTTTIREMFNNYIDDIAVVDNYDKSLCIAYCGTKLTVAGTEYFSDVLDTLVSVIEVQDIAVVEVDDGKLDDKAIEKKLAKIRKLFKWAAGFCAVGTYNKYFED